MKIYDLFKEKGYIITNPTKFIQNEENIDLNDVLNRLESLRNIVDPVMSSITDFVGSIDNLLVRVSGDVKSAENLKYADKNKLDEFEKVRNNIKLLTSFNTAASLKAKDDLEKSRLELSTKLAFVNNKLNRIAQTKNMDDEAREKILFDTIEERKAILKNYNQNLDAVNNNNKQYGVYNIDVDKFFNNFDKLSGMLMTSYSVLPFSDDAKDFMRNELASMGRMSQEIYNNYHAYAAKARNEFNELCDKFGIAKKSDLVKKVSTVIELGSGENSLGIDNSNNTGPGKPNSDIKPNKPEVVPSSELGESVELNELLPMHTLGTADDIKAKTPYKIVNVLTDANGKKFYSFEGVNGLFDSLSFKKYNKKFPDVVVYISGKNSKLEIGKSYNIKGRLEVLGVPCYELEGVNEVVPVSDFQSLEEYKEKNKDIFEIPESVICISNGMNDGGKYVYNQLEIGKEYNVIKPHIINGVTYYELKDVEGLVLATCFKAKELKSDVDTKNDAVLDSLADKTPAPEIPKTKDIDSKNKTKKKCVKQEPGSICPQNKFKKLIRAVAIGGLICVPFLSSLSLLIAALWAIYELMKKDGIVRKGLLGHISKWREKVAAKKENSKNEEINKLKEKIEELEALAKGKKADQELDLDDIELPDLDVDKGKDIPEIPLSPADLKDLDDYVARGLINPEDIKDKSDDEIRYILDKAFKDDFLNNPKKNDSLDDDKLLEEKLTDDELNSLLSDYIAEGKINPEGKSREQLISEIGNIVAFEEIHREDAMGRSL